MRKLLAGVLAIACLAGCVSKSKATRRAQEAFQRGRSAGEFRAAQFRAQLDAPKVTVIGEVRQRIVVWREGLTLLETLIEAEYVGRRFPSLIVVTHQNESTSFPPSMLDQGAGELVMQPGDQIQLLP